MATKKRVAVIGAGLCGIGAMRSIVEEEMEPVCFERTGHYGGLWRYHDEDIEGLASVMKTTVINNSKEIGCLSNYVPPAHLPNHMHNSGIYEFLDGFVKDKNLVQYMRFNKEVEKVEFAEDYQETGRYYVTTKDTKTGDTEKDIFDGVFVCVGHHVFPNWVTFPGQEKFKGRITHTHSLKNVSGFENKNVVVVGIGNSGADACVEISNVSKQVYLSTRRGSWIIPRLGYNGWPIDLYYNRRFVFLLQKWLTYDIFCKIVEKYIEMRFDHSMFNLKPDHHVLSQQPTISDILPVRLMSGTVVVRGNIKQFTEDGVIFENETEVTPVDEVVLATGYITKFPFLGEEITTLKDNQPHLYKFIYPPHLPHPSLAILGLIQSLGAGLPVGEAQCRLAAYAMSGRIKLPNREVMEADISRYKDIFKKRFVNSPRHTIQCDFISYLDEVNELFGAKPNLWKLLFTDPKLWFAVMFGPHFAYQYRLQGPHPWDGARDAIFSWKERVLYPMKNSRIVDDKDEKKKYNHFPHSLVSKRILIPKFVLLFSMMWYMFPYMQDILTV